MPDLRLVQFLDPVGVLRMFHEFDDVFNRIEELPAPNHENMNRANILPVRYLREDLCSISSSDRGSEGEYGHFTAK